MAESTSGKDEKSLGRVSSFSKLMRSPLRSVSSTTKRSKSILGKIFSKKKSSSGKDDENSESHHSDFVAQSEEDFEAVKDISTSPDENKNEDNTKTSIEDEKKHDLIQVDQEAGITNENINNEIKDGMTKVEEGIGKVMEAFEATKIKEKSLEVYQQLPQIPINVNKLIDEVKVSNTIDQFKEVVKDTPSNVEQVTREVGGILEKIQSSLMQNEEASKDKRTKEETKEETIEVVKEKEDDCVSSLAQGLQKICAPWSTKKEN